MRNLRQYPITAQEVETVLEEVLKKELEPGNVGAIAPFVLRELALFLKIHSYMDEFLTYLKGSE